MKSKFVILFIIILSFLILKPKLLFAHEAYVLPQNFFWKRINGAFDFSAFNAFKNTKDVILTLKITIFILLLIIANFLFRLTKLGQKVHLWFEKFSYFGPLFVRLAVALSLFLSAQSDVFLGPELSLSQMPFGYFIKIMLYFLSLMILLGFFSELAGLIGLIIFVIALFSFGSYMLSYLNYFGEFIVLSLFGIRNFSLDQKFKGQLKGLRARFESYETTIVRIFYGLSLMYAAISIKLLRSDISLKVVNDWHLTKFHWLFPSDPYLVVLGAGLAELLIGLFIMIGFELRMTVLISLFYITLSLIYFKELVWPHLILYGISINLLVQPETFTLDHLIFEKYRKEKNILKRIFSHHRNNN